MARPNPPAERGEADRGAPPPARHAPPFAPPDRPTPRPPRAPRAAAALRWTLLLLALGALLAVWARAPQLFQPSRGRRAPVDAPGGLGR